MMTRLHPIKRLQMLNEREKTACSEVLPSPSDEGDYTRAEEYFLECSHTSAVTMRVWALIDLPGSTVPQLPKKASRGVVETLHLQMR
jgi:hypothetical protein